MASFCSFRNSRSWARKTSLLPSISAFIAVRMTSIVSTSTGAFAPSVDGDRDTPPRPARADVVPHDGHAVRAHAGRSRCRRGLVHRDRAVADAEERLAEVAVHGHGVPRPNREMECEVALVHADSHGPDWPPRQLRAVVDRDRARPQVGGGCRREHERSGEDREELRHGRRTLPLRSLKRYRPR